MLLNVQQAGWYGEGDQLSRWCHLPAYHVSPQLSFCFS